MPLGKQRNLMKGMGRKRNSSLPKTDLVAHYKYAKDNYFIDDTGSRGGEIFNGKGIKGNYSSYVDIPLSLNGTYDIEFVCAFNALNTNEYIFDCRYAGGIGYLSKDTANILSLSSGYTLIDDNNYFNTDIDTNLYNYKIKNISLNCSKLILMGISNPSINGNFNGIISDFKIYNQSGELLHQYKCEESAGDKLFDSVGGIHGQIENAVLSEFWIEDDRFNISYLNQEGYTKSSTIEMNNGAQNIITKEADQYIKNINVREINDLHLFNGVWNRYTSEQNAVNTITFYTANPYTDSIQTNAPSGTQGTMTIGDATFDFEYDNLGIYAQDKETICFRASNGFLYIRILKSRLMSEDIGGLVEWLINQSSSYGVYQLENTTSEVLEDPTTDELYEKSLYLDEESNTSIAYNVMIPKKYGTNYCCAYYVDGNPVPLSESGKVRKNLEIINGNMLRFPTCPEFKDSSLFDGMVFYTDLITGNQLNNSHFLHSDNGDIKKLAYYSESQSGSKLNKIRKYFKIGG